MSRQVPDPKPESLTALTIQHAGQVWPLWVAADSEPFIKDLDWGRFLGFRQPRMIRKLIKRLADEGRLGQVICDTTSQNPASDGTGRGRPGGTFYLTEGQALKVAARSETPAADTVLDQMIAVFLKARLGQQVVPAGSAPASAEPQMMNEFMAELRAGREERKATLGILLQLTQRLTTPTTSMMDAVAPAVAPAALTPNSAVSAAPPLSEASVKEAAAVPPPPKAPRKPKPLAPAKQPDLPKPTAPPKETWGGTAQLAARLDMQPLSLRSYLNSHNDLRKLQRADGKWPLEQAAAAIEARRAAAPPPPPRPQLGKSEERDAIVGYVRGWCLSMGFTGDQISEIWHAIYTKFTAEMRYDPRLVKETGQKPLDVIQERGHLAHIGKIAHTVCPAEKMLERRASEAARPA